MCHFVWSHGFWWETLCPSNGFPYRDCVISLTAFKAFFFVFWFQEFYCAVLGSISLDLSFEFCSASSLYRLLCLFPNLGSFQALFHLLFQPGPLFPLFSLHEFHHIVLQIPEALFIFFQSVLFLVFVSGDFFCSVLKFSGSFLCSFHPARSPSSEFFILVIVFSKCPKIAIGFFFTSSIYMLKSSLLLRLSVFSVISSIPVIAHWCIFTTTALKALSDTFNICIITGLASVDRLFSFSLRSSWFWVWWMIFSWNLDILNIMLWDWILCKPSVLAGFLWHCFRRKGRGCTPPTPTTPPAAGGCEVQAPVLSTDAMGRGSPITIW